MNTDRILAMLRRLVAVLLCGTAVHGWAGDALNVGDKVPDASVVKEGLFPEDACRDLVKAGFKCMGFKPAVRFALPATSFKVGSAELPDLLRKQLDVFADVLREKKGSDQKVLIEGHADASGAADANLVLSQRRAEAVKEYLVAKGADATMLATQGKGALQPKDLKDPFSAENRRVEIGRATPP